MILGERDDLENDTLVLNILLQNNMEYNMKYISDKMLSAVLKHIQMWSDGIKRPASGTFVRFKQSTHKKPVIYPDIF